MTIDTYRLWAWQFLRRRARSEGFSEDRHSFTVHSPVRQFVQTLLSGHVCGEYYMSKEEVVVQSFMLHDIVLGMDSKFHLDALKFAREVSFKKDQVVIGCIVRAARGFVDDELVGLLSTFSPDVVLHRWYETLRSGVLQLSVGRKRLVKALAKVLERWEETGRLTLYAIKYRRDLRDIVRITHAAVPRDVWIVIFKRRELAHEVKDEKLRAYLTYSEAVRRGDLEEAYRIAVGHDLPFSLVRALPRTLWTVDVLRIMTPLDLAMFSVSVAKVLGDDPVADAVKARGVKVPTWYSARTLLACLCRRGIDSPLTMAWGRAFTEKVVDVWNDISVRGLDLRNSRILVVLDASGSMEPSRWTGPMWRAVSAIAPVSINVRGLVMFSNNANTEDPKLLASLDGWVKLRDIATGRYSGLTNLCAGLALALEEARRGEYTDVIVITDEQANLADTSLYSTELDLLREITKHANVILFNPATYPVHIAKPMQRLEYVYGKQAEDVLTSLILTRLRNMDDDQIIQLITQTAH